MPTAPVINATGSAISVKRIMPIDKAKNVSASARRQGCCGSRG
jgi:hypothetical protein